MKHPNLTRVRDAFDALASGDIEPAFAMMGDDFLNENDIGAGPWRENRGKEGMLRFWTGWMELFDGSFGQEFLDGIGYDDRVVVIMHETGTARDQAFDNRAIYLFELDGSGRWSALRTFDMDREKIRRFWNAITAQPNQPTTSHPGGPTSRRGHA